MAVAEPRTAGPLVITVETVADGPFKQRYLEIRRRRGKDVRLVTAIEILSPSNKKVGHESRAKYVEKQKEVLYSEAHLVEIDLEELLDVCLRISEELLAGPMREKSDQEMEGRLASVLQAAAAEQATTHSSRLRYALAALHFVERTLGFEISRGARNRTRLKNVGVTAGKCVVISEERRRRQPCGTYSTPDFIVQAMMEDLFGFLRSERVGSADVLDLSMEAGHFPIMCSALRPDWLQLRFFGIDRDPAAVMIVKRIAQFALKDSKENAYRLRTARQNSLFDPLPRYWPRRFKAVIGNPPWRRLDAEGTQLLRERHGPLLRGHDERYLAFMLRAHELLKPGGYLCYVVWKNPVRRHRHYAAVDPRSATSHRCSSSR